MGLFVLVVAHVPLALAIKLGPIDESDTFPFSSWSLYTRVPNQSVIYSIELLRVGDSRDLTGRDFLDSKAMGARRTGIWAHHVIQDLGHAVEAGDRDETTKLRHLFENAYLPFDRPIEYRLIRRAIDPLENLRSGKVEDERVLFTLRAGEQ